MIESLKTIRDWKPGVDLNAIITELAGNQSLVPPTSWTTDLGMVLLLANAWENKYRVTFRRSDDRGYGTIVEWVHDDYPEGEAFHQRASVAMALAFLDTFKLGIDYEDGVEKIHELADRYREDTSA